MTSIPNTDGTRHAVEPPALVPDAPIDDVSAQQALPVLDEGTARLILRLPHHRSGRRTERWHANSVVRNYNVITEVDRLKARLVRIGNSRGVRLPKAAIEQAGLGDEVELDVNEGSIVISRSAKLREGWAEAAAALAERERDHAADSPSTEFDEREWEW